MKRHVEDEDAYLVVLLKRSRCTCSSRSLEPCSFCSRPSDEGEPEGDSAATLGETSTALAPLTFRFYLGTHRPSWLERTDVPLFVSRVTMPKTKLPRAIGPWALDSGAFSEIQLHGRWTLEPAAYVDEVRRYASEIGQLEWASIQDWMCEPVMIARTGLSVEIHQARTIESYLRLRDLAPELPWAPVIQGWTIGDYDRHADAYADAGVDLRALPVVGVGSVCRRQNTLSASLLLAGLAARGLDNLHGFGFKVSGLTAAVRHAAMTGAPMSLASADSLAWSYQARREPPLPECSGHINCANCLRFALEWRERLFSTLERAYRREQGGLFA